MLGSLTPRARAQHELRVEAELASHGPTVAGSILKDPWLGSRWRLVTDPLHQEWPGRWELIGSPAQRSTGGLRRSAGKTPAGTESVAVLQGQGIVVDSMRRPIVIRAGDRVAVTQTTPALEARFPAVALQSARAGERFQGQSLAVKGNAPLLVVLIAQGHGEAALVGTRELQR